MKNIDTNAYYILAVSGGADSMAMLHMFCEKKLNCEVVTINHGLRDESTNECLMVSEFCLSHGIKCTVEVVDVKGYCSENKLSTELGARLLRQNVLASYKGDYICTAHNSDDSVESILMNLLRGSGTDGMQGISSLQGKYLRPVINYTKQQLLDYCNEKGVPYVTDESNNSNDYTRNYLRNEIIPMLKGVNSQASKHILQLADDVKQDNDFICSQLDSSYLTAVDGGVEIDKQLFSLHPSLVVRGLKLAFTKLIGNSVDITRSHYNALIELANNFGGKKLCLPFDIIAFNDYNKVSLVFDKQNNEHFAPVAFSEVVASLAVNGEAVIATKHGDVCVTSTKPNQTTLQFDLAKIPADAVIRTIRQGDSFAKFGGGSKKLNRYLIDCKVPARKRSELLVVASDSCVYVIIGIEISSAVKVEGNATPSYIYQQNKVF